MEIEIKPALIQYWHDPDVPADVAKLVALVGERNPELRHLVFNEGSARELIAQHLTPRELAAFGTCAAPALQADYFRICAVYVLGGVYCDVDCYCKGSLASLLEPEGTVFFLDTRGVPWLVAIDVFGFKAPRHPLLKLALDISTTAIESRFTEHLPFVAGQPVFTLLSEALKCGSLDAHLRQLHEGVAGFAKGPTEASAMHRHLHSIREVVGSHSRVVEAFAGVRVAPISELEEIVERGGGHLAYKKTADHFPYWRGSIFR